MGLLKPTGDKTGVKSRLMKIDKTITIGLLCSLILGILIGIILAQLDLVYAEIIVIEGDGIFISLDVKVTNTTEPLRVY